MKSMTKTEIADAAGVSARTLGRWIEPIMPQMIDRGYRKGMKVWPPGVVRIVVEHLCIDVD